LLYEKSLTLLNQQLKDYDMKTFKKILLPIFLATIWISISEFFRNEFLLKNYWTQHYESLQLIFPSEPLNGAIWGVWSLCFAIIIFYISKKFKYFQTFFISWFAGFILMWLVTWNLGVLPLGILIFAIPLSILEVLLAVFILRKLS
jgi:hypothetical protein